MKNMKDIPMGLICENVNIEFRFPNNPIHHLIQRIALCQNNGMLYHPYSLTDTITYGDNGWNRLSYVFKAGPVELVTFQLGSDTHEHFPTLTLRINAELVYLMGADQLAWRLFRFILKEEFEDWCLHGYIRSLRIAVNTLTPAEELLVLGKYQHTQTHQKPTFFLEDKTERLRMDSKVEVDKAIHSLVWEVSPRKPMVFFTDPRKLPDPLNKVKVFHRLEALKLMILHPEFKEMAIEIASATHDKTNFSQMVKERLSYHQRQKLLALIHQAHLKLWSPALWPLAWRSILKRWKCVSNFAA